MKLSEEQKSRLENLVYEQFVDELPESQWESEKKRLFSEISDSYELHAYAANYNWDDGIEGLKEVITSPLCDKATALMIYGLGEPGYFYRKIEKNEELHDYEQEQWAFLKMIEEKISKEELTEGLISYDPNDFDGGQVFRVNSASPGNRLIPVYMKASTEGEAIEDVLI